jgi:hypothetical protein
LPEAFAAVLADISLGIARGDWFTASTDLQQLLGGPLPHLPPRSPPRSRPPEAQACS